MSDAPKFLIPVGGRDPVYAIAQYLAQHFVWVPDPMQYGRLDNFRWPTREDVQKCLDDHGGVLYGECYDYAFWAAFMLKDCAEIKARVLLCWTEPVPQADEKFAPGYHMVCETEDGKVIDCRRPSLVSIWDDLIGSGYKRDEMSGFIEFGEIDQWVKCVGPDVDQSQNSDR